MKKSVKFIAGLTAVLLTMGMAGCTGGNTVYPNFINQANQGEQPVVGEKYVVNVLSEGGLKLDGVRVAAKNSQGQTVKLGISKGGKIEFGISLGEYTLVVDEESLPAGYSVTDAVYKTNPAKRDDVTIKLPSKLIGSSSGEAASYKLGTIMKDFTFTDSNGNRHVLSELFASGKKAVVLNFWYSQCGPCRAEFPYLQAEYANRKASHNDVEVLAICSTSYGDNNEKVAAFAESNNITFPMGMDWGLGNAFGVRSFPTTVVIDRYGLIAAIAAGSEPSTAFWRKLFADYCSDNYVQNVANSDGSGGDTEDGREKPDVKMPASSEIEAAVNGDGFEATYRADDDEYSWPWLVGSDGEGSYIYSSNKGKGNSYSIIYADLEMKEGQVLSFEYNVSSEPDRDILYVMLDGSPVNGDGWSGEGGWHSVDIYVADRDKKVELAFAFRKDPADDDSIGDDVAKIRNIHLADNSAITTPIDVVRTCASGEVTDFKYGHYVNAVLGSDGFYHKDTADGALIYATVNNVTPWSELHTGNTSEGENGTVVYNTLFNMTAENYFNSENSTVIIGGVDVTEAYTVYVQIFRYMPAPYYLMPVTPILKEWLDAFVNDYEGGKAHKDEWLEFCYYYDHYGSDDLSHTGNETCNVNVDYTRGLTKYNCYQAYEKDDPALKTSDKYNEKTGRNIADIKYPLQLAHNGSYYKFTANKTGVYNVRSYTSGCSPEGNEPDENGYTPAAPQISVYSVNDEYITSNVEPRDFDVFQGEEYEGFNTYLTLKAGESVFLYLENIPQYTTYYDFEIKYLGETYEKMLVCSTDGGAWTTVQIDGKEVLRYLAVDVGYDKETDCYYLKDAKGNLLLDQPIYIDMIYGSYFMSNIGYSYNPLEFLIRDSVFAKHIKYGDEYQAVMEEYLGKAREEDESSPTYGLVKANAQIVDIINKLIDANVDGGMGVGNGWLTFAVYNAKFRL